MSSQTKGKREAKSSQTQQQSKKKNKNKNKRVSKRDIEVFAAPVSKQAVIRTQTAVVRSLENGNIRIRHREFIADVSGTVAGDFTVSSFPINPGMPLLFPWLAQIARNYESYRFHKLSFEYYTASPTTVSGSVMLAVDFDATDPAPPSKVEMLQYYGAVRSAVWEPCKYHCTVENMNKLGPKKFIRFGVLPPNQDIKTYDVGSFFFATQTQATASGELWVSYDVEFNTPQVDSVLAAFYVSAKITSNIPSLGSAWSAEPTPSTVQGGLAIRVQDNNMYFDVGGQFLIYFSTSGTTIANVPDFTGSTVNYAPIDQLVNGAATSANFVVIVTSIPGQYLVTDFAVPYLTLTRLVARVATYSYSLA